MRLIRLSKGQVAKVDDADFEWLSQWKWSVYLSNTTRTYYAVRKDSANKSIYMARQILGLERGDRRHGDHINHDTLDNQRENLRILSLSESQWNTLTPRNNTSGYKGVTAYGLRWKARINIDRSTRHLGVFDTAEAAHLAYLDAVKRVRGEQYTHQL